MTAARPDNEVIFHAARDIPDPDRRRQYVREMCGGDEARIALVEALLAAADRTDSLLDRPLAGTPVATIDQPATESPGTLIGPYKLIEPIGEGGMGSVWMAQQTEPVRRLVAVKLIKAGMDSRQVIARFEAERQALALMDHPHIARVLDGGTTSSGRPYFVMDLVKGVPITRYCDEHHLTPRQRLELFIPVCQAVQHAHQKGIIHRDLKPSNVLVALYDGRPVPKIIDFGVAKATGQQLTDKTLVTGFGAVVGTLEYMSPEQAEVNQLDIDTRSDIYALGVLLYELLTGSPPINRKELEKAGMLEMLRVIREQEPTKPSTKLSTADGLPTLAANRGTEPARLTKLVRGELDWIVMKALEKDRNRRYETANGFAMDVQRYLADEPVQACPPSAGYRLRKFARRHKAALAMTFVLLVAAVVASAAVVGSVGWAICDRAARQAAVEVGVETALKEAERLQSRRRYSEALKAAMRAEGLVAGSSVPNLQTRVRKLRKDLQMVLNLERIRLAVFETGEGIDLAREAAEYAAAFRDFGIDPETLNSQEAAERIRATTIRTELASAIDDWAFVRGMARKNDDEGRKKLMSVARLVDPDALRNQIRDAQESLDAKRLKELVHSEKFHELERPTLALLGLALWQTKQFEEGLVVLKRQQIQHPDDFWFKHILAGYLVEKEPLRAIRYRTAAHALRPESHTVTNNLAWLLVTCPHPGLGDPDEAVSLAKKAVEQNPKQGRYWTCLGAAHYRARQWNAAVDACNKSMDLRAGGVSFDWFLLAMAYWQLGDKVESRKWYDKAVQWMEKNEPEEPELRRFRQEATALLKIAEKS